MTRLWNNHRTGVIIALAVMLILAFTSLYVVGEEEQAVVIRTGEPVGVANTPGGEKGAEGADPQRSKHAVGPGAFRGLGARVPH